MNAVRALTTVLASPSVKMRWGHFAAPVQLDITLIQLEPLVKVRSLSTISSVCTLFITVASDYLEVLETRCTKLMRLALWPGLEIWNNVVGKGT